MRISRPASRALLVPVCALVVTAAFLYAARRGDPAPPCMKPCPAPPSWFPVTPKPLYEKPDPDSDCDFYKAAWQTLLYITQPGTPGETQARFLSFETKDDLFGGQVVSRFPKTAKPTLLLAPRLKKQRMPLSGSDILQAQSQGILVDKNGRAVNYSIHLNDVFAKFIRSNGYTDFIRLKFAGDQEFPRGSLELKASWRIVPDDEPAEVTAKYFVVPNAMVSKLKLNAKGQIEIDPNNTARASRAAGDPRGRRPGRPPRIRLGNLRALRQRPRRFDESRQHRQPGPRQAGRYLEGLHLLQEGDHRVRLQHI